MIALHDLNLAARFGDTILAMKQGRLAAWGKAAQVLQPELIEDIYGLPVQVFRTPDDRQSLIWPI